MSGLACFFAAFGIATYWKSDSHDQMSELNCRQYARISVVFIALASTAFAIASIGLLGIAVHAAGRRRHEIAVRKTLGSRVFHVVKLLLTDFSVLVLIGNIIAWPFGYFAARDLPRHLRRPHRALSRAFPPVDGHHPRDRMGRGDGVVLRAAGVRPAEVLRHA